MSNKWDTNLEKSSRYSNNETLNGIKILASRFFIAEDKLEECCRNESEAGRQYSSGWIKDMELRFGKETLIKNTGLIKTVLLYLRMKQSSLFCKEQEKEILYCEMYLKKAIEDYVYKFSEFYQTVDLKQQTKIIKYKKNMVLLSDFTEKRLFYHKTIGSFPQKVTFPLSRLELNNWMDSPLAQFLIQHPDLKAPFDLIMAVDDLQRVIEN